MKYLLVIRGVMVGVMVLGLLNFFLFWYVPSMRSQFAYRHAMDEVFDKAQSCWESNYDSGNYTAAIRCFDEWDSWHARNQVPDLGFNWPWAVWKAQTEDK